MLIPILVLAAGCSLALTTALNDDSPVTDGSNATAQERNPSAADTTARECVCEPATGRLSAEATLSDRAGRYLLTLVTDSGISEYNGTVGLVASGLLTLRPQLQEPESPDDPSTPLYGFTDIDPESVGAHRVGDPASKDPLAPGVLVLEREEYGRRIITLRLGSLANRRDLVRYDGAYTVLRVNEIDEGGFAGSWRSGGGPDFSVTTGCFCASKVP